MLIENQNLNFKIYQLIPNNRANGVSYPYIIYNTWTTNKDKSSQNRI